MEIKSKNWDLVQQVSWNWNPIKFNFGNVTERYFWKHNPDENWGHNDLRTVCFTYRDFHSRSAIFTWPSIFTLMEFLKQSEANIKTSQKLIFRKIFKFLFSGPNWFFVEWNFDVILRYPEIHPKYILLIFYELVILVKNH